MIIVVTHNGLLPSQGGKRIGYQIGDWFFHLLTQKWYSVSAVLAQARSAKKPQTTAAAETAGATIVYFSLPTCNCFGDCAFCDRQDNRSRAVQTDVGLMEVVTCKGCGRKMRYRP